LTPYRITSQPRPRATPPRFSTVVLGAFAGGALLLAAIGL
jgi:hypothetical protein